MVIFLFASIICTSQRIILDECHDLCFDSCLVSSFPVFFWKSLTSLSFQVPCPSSCVKCLIVFPDSQSVSTCSPWFLMCSNSLRLPLSCASVLCFSMSLILALFPQYSQPQFLEPAVSDPPAEQYPFVVICSLFHSFSLFNHGKFHGLVLFLRLLERFLVLF